MKMQVIVFALLAAMSAHANEWIEKFYPGLEAGGKVNFLEKGYLGKEKAIEIVYASGLAKFGVAKDVETDLKGVVDWTVSAMVSGGEGGSVAAAMEFFDAKGESLKLDTGRSYRTKPGIGGKENWNLATWRFTSPKKAVRASVHLLSTGKVPVRFAKVDVKSAQGVDTDEMPFNVTAWPVAWNPDWHGGEQDMVNFSDAPIPVTFALFGERDEVKEPAFEIVMPEGLEIRDAFCANYHDYGREEPTSATSETFAGVACRRYRFENPIAARSLKRQRDLDRLYGITMVIAPKGGQPASGDYVIGYRVTCNGKKGLERTFKMKYQPLPKGLKRAPNFQVFTWTDQDRNFSRDDVYADSMKAFAAAGLTTKHRNGIYRPDASYDQAQCESKRASEIAEMIKRDYPEAIISYELQDLWRPFNCRLSPELEKEVAAHMAKTIDAAHMHAGTICPQYFATSRKLHDHLRDNVIVADLKRFGVRDGDWVELDMEPWECQTWCFCDDCLKAFAEFHGLDRVPTIEEAGADPDKWADFRTSQSMKSTRLLAEIVHAYNPKLVVVDYDYILDYGNEKAERNFRRQCAKDAFRNEKWLDGHLASYYHTIGKAAFDAIRNNVRYLKKPYYPMGGLTGYGGYLRPGEVLDEKQFRQLGLAAFVNGCPGWAFYNGTCFDGRQIIAMMRVQDDAARYGHLPWGKIDGKTVPTCGNPLFAYASTVGKDGVETVALFNYDRNEPISVRLAGRDYTVEASDVRFVTLSDVVVADKAAASFKYPVTAVKDGRENIEWSTAYSYHVTDGRSSLPRVLLIGDSITAGYQGAVAKKLEGKVNVTYWASSYGVTAPMYWKLAETYLTDLRYDAVHFCPGTHSYHATDEEIETGARRLIALIREKQPQAKLIWCSKTPVTNEMTNAKSLSINRITGRVAKEMGVEWRDDLYLLMKPYDHATYWRDPFHFKPAGIDLQAEQVAQSVLAALGLSPSRPQEKISVFAKFIRQTAKERGISLSAAADLLYDLGELDGDRPRQVPGK